MRSAMRSPAGWSVASKFASLFIIIGGLLTGSAAFAQNDVVLDAGCVLDQPTAPNGLNCTANDTTLSSPSIVVLEPCDFPGDTAILDVTVDITVGAQTRYDLGVWVSIDGDPNLDGSESGECAVLSVPNDILHVDQLTTTFGDTDYCGDVFNVDPDGIVVPPTETAHVLNAALGTFPVLCDDSDGDGQIDIPVIVAWKQQSNNDCAVSNDTVPGTAAKCTRDDSLALDIPIPGRITVTKSTIPAAATQFQFNLSGPSSDVEGGFDGSEDFMLANGEVFDTANITGGVYEGIYSVTEDAAPGYITTVSCIGSEGEEDPVAINLSPGEEVNCVFINTLDSATINVVKNTVGGNGQFTVNWAGPTTSGDVLLDTGVINTDTEIIVTTETGAFTLTEVIPAGWALGNAACVDDNGGAGVGTWDNVDTINGIDLSPGQSVTCTFTNQAIGTVMLVKNTVGGDGSFDFVTDVPGLGTNIQTSVGTGMTSASNVPAGTYSIVETVPAGWILDSATCDDGSPPDALVLTANETVTCTFVDIKLGTVIVEKQTLPDGDPEQFDFTGDIAGTIGDGGQIVVSNLLPATYVSTETVPEGWDLTSIVCDDENSSGDTEAGSATFNIEAGEIVTCVFTNTKDGSIEVVKSLAATGPSVETFGFTSNFNGAFDLVGDAATTGPIAVAPGNSYTVSEDDPSADGWVNSGASCGDGSNPLTGIDVSPGEAVVCTFTNTPLGSAVVIKDTIGGNGIFGFTGDDPIGPFSLDTTDQFTASTGDLFDYILTAGVYDVTEDNIPAGWELTSIGCDDGSLTDVDTATASMDVQLAETVTCIFTNTADGTLIIRKETLPEDAELGFDFTGEAAGTIRDFSATADEIVVSGQPGTYTSTELVPPGWSITDISCTGDVQSDVTIGADNVSVDLVAGETVICTFENTIQGSITIEKFTQGGLGAFQFNGDFGSFQLDTNIANPDSTSFTNLLPGIYMVSEIVPSNWTLSDIQCSAGDGTIITIGGEGGFDPGDQGVTIDLADGDSVVCTFINDADGSISVTKATEPAGSPQSFDFSGDITATLTDGQTSTAVLVPPGNYSVTEAAIAGWDITGIACSDDDSTGAGDTASFVVAPGEVVNCIFTNTQRGTITLVKELPNDNGGDAVETDFTAFIDGTTVPWGVAQEYAPGNYTASETTLTGYEPSGWFTDCAADGSVTLGPGENLTCTITNDDIAPTLTLVKTVVNDNGGLLEQSDFPSFVNGTPQAWDVATEVQANTLLTASETPQTGYAPSAWGGDCASDGTITLLPGDVKTCTITNDDVAPLLTLIKDPTNDDFGTALPDDFLPTVGGVVVVSGESNPYEANLPYAIDETLLPGYSFVSITGDVKCPAVLGDPVTLAPGDDITCTITNDDDPAAINLVKTAADPVREDGTGTYAVGTYTVVYTITATNNGAGPGEYDIVDTFDPAVGLVLNSAELTSYNAGTEDSQTGAVSGVMPYTFTSGDTLVTGEALAAGLDESWTITANFSVVQGDLDGSETDCVKNAPEAGKGFYNSVSGNIEEDESDNIACVNLPQINLAKTATGPTLEDGNGNYPAGTYTVVYTVTATNSGDVASTYDLVDTLEPAAGLSLNAVELTNYTPGTENSQTGTLAGVMPFEFASGDTIVTSEGLEVGLNESWTITANFTVISEELDGNASICNPDDPQAGEGFYNLVEGNIVEDESDNRACVALVEPQINLAKTSTPAENVGGDTWEVVYTITATNSGDGPGVYDIIDNLLPGDGIVPVIDGSYPAIAYVGGETQTGVITAPPLANGGTWVTLEGLVAQASESWTVTARFTVDEQALTETPTNADCMFEANEQGTGYFNYVEGSETDEDLTDNETCVPHILPAAPVPTLSTWAMLLMILLMTGVAAWFFRPVHTRRIS